MLQRLVLTAEPIRATRGGSSAENPCSVSALVESSDKALRDAAGTLWVRGEISGWKPNRWYESRTVTLNGTETPTRNDDEVAFKPGYAPAPNPP